MTGRLIAVVGPSGVGKDSLIAGILRARPDVCLARRAITRAASDTEPFEPVTEAEFAQRRDAGRFAVHWQAHGLSYGVPIETLAAALAGRDVIANLSRGVLARADEVFPALMVLSVTAPAQVLTERLKGRGREDLEEIARRLARPAPVLPEGARLVTIDNGGGLGAAVAASLRALDQERAE